MACNETIRKSTRVILLSCAAVVLLSSMAVAAAPACSRVSLKQALPQWISSAAYLGSQDRIGLVDPLRNKVLLVSPSDGESREFEATDWGLPERELTPAILNATPGGFVLSLIDQRLLKLDRDLNRVALDDFNRPAKSGGSIVTTYDFVVTGEDILGVGALKTNQGYRFGFFRAPLAEPYQFVVLKDVPSVLHYTIGNRYVVGLEGKKYGVLMTPQPVILEFSANGLSRTLDLIPEGYQALPLKTQPTGPTSDEALYKEIEGLRMPAGLYAENGLLYLLTREPGQGGATVWRLWPIDPAQSRPATLSIKLPTGANHLTVVSTAKNWYVFERGAAQSTGNQSILSMLVIPNRQIRSGAVPATCPGRK
jgi:hypothetical protein